jgi:S1-C subfamily serine protease
MEGFYVILCCILLILITIIIVIIRCSRSTNDEAGSIMYNAVKNYTVTTISTFSNSSSFGSGFIIESKPPYIMIGTCAHTLLHNGGKSHPLITAFKIEVVITGANGDPNCNIQLDCEIIGMDVAADIAVIRTCPSGVENGFDFTRLQGALKWGNSSLLVPGMDCYIIGNPLGGDFTSIASGVVRDHKYIGTFQGGCVESLYCSVPILAGCSGSPILDKSGLIIGISCWVSSTNNSSQESFTGGPNQYMAERIIDRIIASHSDYDDITTRKGFIGITDSNLVAGLMLSSLREKYPYFRQSDMDIPLGIYVKTVSDMIYAVPAIKVGDILLSIEKESGKTYLGAFDHQYSPTRISWFTPPGEYIVIEVVRPSNCTRFTSKVRIMEFPKELDVVLSKAF